MSASTAALARVRQSLWLDTISRGMLDDGTLARSLAEFHVTGLTSNPSISNLAFKDAAFVTSWNDLLGVVETRLRAVAADRRLPLGEVPEGGRERYHTAPPAG